MWGPPGKAQEALVVLKTEYSRSGRQGAVVKMKYKNLLNGAGGEWVFSADDKLDQVILDKKEAEYSYFDGTMYVFMDPVSYEQYNVEPAAMGSALNYLQDGMKVEVTFYNENAISVELPTTVVREIHGTGRQGRHVVGQGAEGRAHQRQRRIHDHGAAVLQHRRKDRNRHAYGRVQEPRQVIWRSTNKKGSFALPFLLPAKNEAGMPPAIASRYVTQSACPHAAYAAPACRPIAAAASTNP